MSKKIRISVEFKSLVESCVAYYEAKSELSEIRSKWGGVVAQYDELLAKIDGLRMKLVVEQGMKWDEALTKTVGGISLSEEYYSKICAKKEDAQTELVERCKPVQKIVNAYATSIATVEGLYTSYVLAMKKGDWDAEGAYRNDRDKVVVVNTSFRQNLLTLMKKYGCGINAKSGRTCEDTIFVRLGGKHSKNGFAAHTKRAFVDLFVDCVLQYMVDTNQL